MSPVAPSGRFHGVEATLLRRCAPRLDVEMHSIWWRPGTRISRSRRQLDLAARWADLRPTDSLAHAAAFTAFGLEEEEPIAGEGCPLVADYCVAELGTVLGLTTISATRLIGQALELRHRLPRLWALVHAGKVPAWQARSIAETTIHTTPRLSRDAARWVDLHPTNSLAHAAAFPTVGLADDEPIAGEGCPLVADYCTAELGTVLGITTVGATRLIGHALELRHRLPRLWALVHAGKVPAWRARSIAETTIHTTPRLSRDAA